MSRVLVIGSFAESLILFRGTLLKGFVSHGCEVFACAPFASNDIKDKLSELGVVYRDVYLSRAGLNPLDDVRTFFSLVKLMRTIKPDVVLSYTIKPVLYGSLAARLAGVPGINSIITGLGYIFINNSLKDKLIGSIARFLYKLTLKFNDKVFFQNPDDLDLFLKLGLLRKKEQTVLINGSGIDLDAFKLRSKPQKTSFLLIARLLKDKGVYEYVDAASKIKEKYPDIIFKIVGWMDNNPASIRERDLVTWIQGGIIEYLGRLDDVRPAIAEASVYVLPSYREGTPRTVLEAMAMGRAIITSDAPGCRETVVGGENGFLVPVKDTNALAHAMERFIEEPELIERMGKRSREIAEEKYDVHKVNAVIMKAMGLVDEKGV